MEIVHKEQQIHGIVMRVYLFVPSLSYFSAKIGLRCIVERKMKRIRLVGNNLI